MYISRDWRIGSASYVLGFSLIYMLLLLITLFLFHADHATDYNQYLGIAQWAGANIEVNGEVVTVKEPFASRIIGPWLAHWVSRLANLSIEHSFLLLTTGFWLTVGPIVGRYFWTQGVPFGHAAVVATLPYPAIAATRYMVPDSISVVLLLLVIFGLRRGRTIAPAVATALQMLARSTSLFTICLWLAACRAEIGWRRASVILAAAAAGLALLAIARPFPAAHEHHISPLLYFVLKFPVNYMKNLFGFALTTDDAEFCPPIATLDLGGGFLLGSIHRVEICPFDIRTLVLTLSTLAFILGLLPFLCIRVLLRRAAGDPLSVLRAYAPEAAFLFCFLLIPGMGVTMPRLALDAYVLLIPIAPKLLHRYKRQQTAMLFCLYNFAGIVMINLMSTTFSLW